MKTASFFTYTGPGRVSVARFPPRGTPAGFRVYRALAPGPWFGSVGKEAYEQRFAAQLAALDPRAVYDELVALAAPDEPVLLCWEKPPFSDANWCHRRLVAAWLECELGVRIEEVAP